MRARASILLLILAAFLAGQGRPTSASARVADKGTTDTDQLYADLRVRLEKDLMARMPNEFAFVDLVLEKVKSGELPLKMVNGTYLWARVKRPYPFVYFQRALQFRAARIGVKLPIPIVPEKKTSGSQGVRN